MAIVAVEIESVHGATTGRHLVFYRCQDDQGQWHSYGPINAAPGFDADGLKATVAEKMAEDLAEAEFRRLLL